MIYVSLVLFQYILFATSSHFLSWLGILWCLACQQRSIAGHEFYVGVSLHLTRTLYWNWLGWALWSRSKSDSSICWPGRYSSMSPWIHQISENLYYFLYLFICSYIVYSWIIIILCVIILFASVGFHKIYSCFLQVLESKFHTALVAAHHPLLWKMIKTKLPCSHALSLIMNFLFILT